MYCYGAGASNIHNSRGKKPAEKTFHCKMCNEENIISNMTIKKNPLFQNPKKYMSYSMKHPSLQESLWPNEWKFQAVVRNPDCLLQLLLFRLTEKPPQAACGSAAMLGNVSAGCCPECSPKPPTPWLPRLSPAFPQGPAAADKLQEETDVRWTRPCQWWWGSFLSEQPRGSDPHCSHKILEPSAGEAAAALTHGEGKSQKLECPELEWTH